MREMERKNTSLFRSESKSAATTSSDILLQWGNRKRLRCMKVHVKDHSGINNEPAGSGRPTARGDRRVVRSAINNSNNNLSKDATSNKQNTSFALRNDNGYLNLRQRPPSPSRRILRNSESSIGAMKGHSNERKGTPINNNNNNNHPHPTKNSNHSNDNYHHGGGGGGGGGSGSSETTHDGKKGGSSSGGDTNAAVWPPKFVIALTNKEKEEDFMVLKGSKLPQRPKKRAKIIQRTLNLVSPGTWLCDLTIERYEVRQKKVSKKRPRGLKAMGGMESDSE